MYGYRLPTEAEQLRLWERIEDAIARRTPLHVTYFEQRKDDNGKPLFYSNGRPALVKTTRIVEPYEVDMTRDGHMIMRTVDRKRMAEEKLAIRTVRLDRIGVSLATRRPLMRALRRDTYKVPNPYLPELVGA